MKATHTHLYSVKNNPGKQTGFSLIELMIASVIGLVLLGGVVTIFSSNSASSKMSTGMARLQDSGRVALDILSYGVRMTGYEGCRDESKEAIRVLANNAPSPIDFPASAIRGFEVNNASVWSPAIHSDLDGAVNSIENDVKPDSDVLYLQYGSGRSVVLSSDMASSSAGIVLPSNPDYLDRGDLVMIADCDSADVIRATDVTVDTATGITTVQHTTASNISADLTQAYQGTGEMNAVPVRVMRFESKAYYVADSGRNMPDGSEIWSLFELDTTTLDSVPTEIIEGVEEFQVLYGVQTDPEVLSSVSYLTADNVTDFSQVVSVQLGLLVSTTDYSSSSSDTETYNVAGWTVGPGTTTDSQHAGDKRLRASFNATIQLRNRIL